MSDLGPGSTVAGKFRLERLIGRGGMGSVWAARHLQLDTLVAIKFIDAVGDVSDAKMRFEREARAAAQLRSPHVVQILDHGIDEEDRPYIAMELLEGEDLGERLRRTPRLSLPAAATIITQAAKALRRAHESGVIHRDLKPGNIFLARFDDDEVVKLLDFGVAKLRYNELAPGVQMTQTGVIFGSPSYMSPEQARGNRVIDHRTDLWSLAVILFRCITGSKPFEAGSIGDLVIKLCIDALPMPTKFAPDLPPEVDRFFERAFAREPDLRFQSATALAQEFEAIARPGFSATATASIGGTMVIPAPPPSRPQQHALPASLTPQSGVQGASARFEVPPFTPAPLGAAVTPLPSITPSGPYARPESAPSRPEQREIPPPAPSNPFGAQTGAFGAASGAYGTPSGSFGGASGAYGAPSGSFGGVSGAYGAPPAEPAPPTPQPASMTPSPALMAVGAFASSMPARNRFIAAASLAGGVLLLLAIVIAVAVHRSGPSTSASDEEGAAPSASAAPIVLPPPSATAAATPPPSAAPEPAATVAPIPEPSASAVEPEPDPEPASSASPATSASGRKNGSGKPGRGRTPNFGY